MLTELSECCAVKLFAIVYSDFFGYAEAAYNVLPEEFLQSGGRDVAKSFGFDPLRKVLYGDCCILEVAWSCWQGSYNVDAPSCEGPDWGYEVVTSQKSAKLNRATIIFKTKCSIVELKNPLKP